MFHEFFEYLGLNRYVDEHIDNRIYQRLSRLVSENPVTEVYYKNQWLQTGLVDTATDFDSFVDLRPRFSDDMSGVEEFIPVVIFRAIVENDRGEEKSHVFQLSEDGVDALRLTLEIIDRQLGALKGRGDFVGSETPASAEGWRREGR